MFTHLHAYREGKVLYLEKKILYTGICIKDFAKETSSVQASVPFAATVYMCRKEPKFAVLNPAVL